MQKFLLAAAVAIVGLSSLPAFAHDTRYDHEVRMRQAAVERDRAQLRHDIWANRHGARNGAEIAADRRVLAHDESALRRILAGARGW